MNDTAAPAFADEVISAFIVDIKPQQISFINEISEFYTKMQLHFRTVVVWMALYFL